MDILKLFLIFASIIIIMGFKKPLSISISGGIIPSIILYKIPIIDGIKAMANSALSRDMLILVLSYYSITFLQRMLEKKDYLMLAEKSLSNIFNSRRVNAMIAPFVIGMLPSPGAVLIAAPIVDKAGGNFVTKEEKTFITSYYRHISESFMPTYAYIILAINLSGVDMTHFVLGMLPLVLMLFLLGFIFYVRKIPKETGLPKSLNKKQDIKNIFISLCSIALATSLY